MSYHELETGNANCELGRKIYMRALEDRRGFRYDQIGIHDPEIWREIFEAIGKTAKAALKASS